MSCRPRPGQTGRDPSPPAAADFPLHFPRFRSSYVLPRNLHLWHLRHPPSCPRSHCCGCAPRCLRTGPCGKCIGMVKQLPIGKYGTVKYSILPTSPSLRKSYFPGFVPVPKHFPLSTTLPAQGIGCDHDAWTVICNCSTLCIWKLLTQSEQILYIRTIYIYIHIYISIPFTHVCV